LPDVTTIADEVDGPVDAIDGQLHERYEHVSCSIAVPRLRTILQPAVILADRQASAPNEGCGTGKVFAMLSSVCDALAIVRYDCLPAENVRGLLKC
jgi:hypothetical protein